MSSESKPVRSEEDVQFAHIKFSTQIIKRLGEELNPSFDQSILELVKNSYDADALKCTVVLKNVTELGGSIEVEDTGDGMDGNGIRNGWLVLGQSHKSLQKLSRLERISAGSKGLGRLAALRMGNMASVTSIPYIDPLSKYSLVIDWDVFDNAALVEEVQLPINHTSPEKNEKVGTKIVISGLRQSISERDVKKIARGLILLSDPFDDDPKAFKPTLKAPEFKQLEVLVAKRYFDDADYHLVASINNLGQAEAKILDYRGEVLFSADHVDIIGKDKAKIYHCPATEFNLWAFLLNATTFSTRSTTIGEVREWLNEFGGVHLYENGLRVNPYGNSGNDWLDLNLSRARSPEERPSTNTSIGKVTVKDSKGLLSQKTDRSGFIENEVFHQIKLFCYDALEWMAKKRIEQAEIRRQKERVASGTISQVKKEDVKKLISELPVETRVSFEKTFKAYEKSQEKVVKNLKSEVQLYRTLSTAGITAATFSHESSGNPIKIITITISSLEKRIKNKLGSDFDEVFAKPISMIRNAIESLAVLGTTTLKLLAHDKRRPVKLDVHKVIHDIVDTFDPFLKGRNINLQLELADGNPFLRGTEASVESVITNLLNNSIVALERSPVGQRIIKIRTTVSATSMEILVSDNGPGIKDINIRDIWLPGQSTNPNGTGLGLTIVRDAVIDLGGESSAQVTSELGGAEISIKLPILGIA